MSHMFFLAKPTLSEKAKTYNLNKDYSHQNKEKQHESNIPNNLGDSDYHIDFFLTFRGLTFVIVKFKIASITNSNKNAFQ